MHLKLAYTCFLMVLLAVVWSYRPATAGGTGSIFGKITTGNGDALGGVLVNVSSSEQTAVATTDREGLFKIHNLIPGAYVVIATREDLPCLVASDNFKITEDSTATIMISFPSAKFAASATKSAASCYTR